MSYIFTRQNNTGLISGSAGVILASPDKATVYTPDGASVYVNFPGYTWAAQFSDIQSIGGVTPANIGDAIYLISTTIFPEKTITLTVA